MERKITILYYKKSHTNGLQANNWFAVSAIFVNRELIHISVFTCCKGNRKYFNALYGGTEPKPTRVSLMIIHKTW